MTNKMIILPYDKYLKLINVKKESDEITNNNNHSDNINLPNLEKIENVSNKEEENIRKSSVESSSLSEDGSTNLLTENKNDTVTSLNIDENKDLLTEDDIINYIPKKFRNKCKLMINHMQKHNINWDSYGRLLLGYECLVDSHIVDLLRDNICSNKQVSDKNSETFMELLKVTHCPKSFISSFRSEDGEPKIKRKKTIKKNIL